MCRQHLNRRRMLSLSGAFIVSSAVGLGGGQTKGTVSATSNSESRIHQRFTVRWDPDRDQHLEISAQYERENVEGNMAIYVPEAGTVVDSGEFEQEGTQQFTTSNDTRFVYSIPVNPDEYHNIFGDEEWALAAPHQILSLVRFPSKTQPVIDGMEIHDEESDSGMVGGWHVYLGEYESYVEEADEETIELIVPEAASLDGSPTDFVEELAFASDRLSVGGTADTVYKFVVPDDWPGGSSDGSNNSAWTNHTIPLTWDHNGLSVWVHEYVHTRQVYGSAEMGFIQTSGTRWLFEGLADHYGALIPYESGTATFDELRRSYERGYRDRHEDAVLVDEESWREERGDYTLGALVLGKIDLEIRRETDADRSLDEVLQQINEIPFDDEFTHEQLLDIIRDVASDDVAALADTYITSTERPDFWSEQTHKQYFPEPAIAGDDEASSDEGDEERSEEEGGSSEEEEESSGEEDGGSSEDEEGTSDEEEGGDSDEDEESSDEEDETTPANGTDDEVPGLGVVATLTGLGSVLGYHLLSSDEMSEE